MKAVLVALLALSGCYFKTRDTLVETPVSQAKVSTNIVTASQPDVVAKTRDNVIAFRVETRRTCTTQAVQDFEVRHEKKPEFKLSIFLVPLIVVPAAFLAVPVVSGLVAVMSSKKAEHTTETRVISRNTYACSLRLGDQVVQVHFPSGITLEGRTDANGIASVTIPDEEIDHGTARIVFAEHERKVDYDRRGYDAEQLAIVVDE
jgi:hypothetical protein